MGNKYVVYLWLKDFKGEWCYVDVYQGEWLLVAIYHIIKAKIEDVGCVRFEWR